MVPSDIKVLRNHIDKPLSWKGSVWDVKNLFELKNAQDVLIEGNVFAYNWLAAQTGYAIAVHASKPVRRASLVRRAARRVPQQHRAARQHVFNILGRDNNSRAS